MTANVAVEETTLLDAAVAWLQERLPSKWQVSRSNRSVSGPGPPPQPLTDGAIDIQSPQAAMVTMVVEAKKNFQPRDVDLLLPQIARVFRTLAGNTPLLVVAPWLSPRTRVRLADSGINYIDLTGNARIDLEYPGLYLETSGADRDPSPPPRPPATLRGPRAGRLIRLLIDVAPPYGVREIATATRLSAGYVSRLLDTLDREALIERARGAVADVDLRGLLTRWSEVYDLFKSNRVATFLAPPGAGRLLGDLARLPPGQRTAVTGSFAASRIAPVAAPALLVVYCEDAQALATGLGLIPADTGANVALLAPYDPVVWERGTTEGGLIYVAASQVAVDCLTGNGRMPAEGDAVLTWMLEDETRWRATSLAAMSDARTTS